MLLDTKAFRPYRRKRHYYLQDEMVVFYDYKSNNWQIMLNYEITEGKFPLPFLRKLAEITSKFKEEERIVCYINDLRLAMVMIPGGEVEGEKTDASNTKHPVYYTTKNIEFRNFSLFHISGKGNGALSASQMYDYLRTLADKIGKKTINACQYTVGYMSKKILTYGLDKKILDWNGKNHNFVDSVKEYEDSLIGCKCGLLKAIKGIHDDVLMIDIKSAYLSAFVHLDCFPIGRKKHYSGKSAMIKFLKNEYYQVIITTEDDFEVFSDHKQGNKYGFYKFDFDEFTECGVDLKKWVVEQYKNGATIEIYDSQKYGRLMKPIVDRMVEFYNNKQTATGNDKDAIKAFTEMIYGKGLQKRKFESDKEAYTYFLRPENVMRPEYSMMACSYIRMRMSKMIKELGGSYYNDTDGIECAYSEKNEEIVKKENERILKINKELGYDCNIGTWKFEERHAKISIITRKQRMYIGDNGELTVKVAGINKKDVMKHLREEDIKDVMKYFNEKRSIRVPEYEFDYVNGFWDTRKKFVNLGR